MGTVRRGNHNRPNIEVIFALLDVIMSNRVSSFLGDLYPKCTDAFSRHDKEKTGKIATKDVGPIIAEIFGRSLPEDQLQQQIKRFIDDGDEALSEPEFLSLMGMIHMQEESFRRFDKDGNGFLSKEEIKELISSTTTLSDEKAEKIIKESDVNGNGEIYFEEFMKLFFLLEES